MKIAMVPGSFDPPTLGHINIIERSINLFDKLYVVVADNIKKKSLLTTEEKVDLLSRIFVDNNKIEVVSFSGLMAEFARENDVDVIIRGVRAQDDFNFEFELAMNNRNLNANLETLFIPTDQKYFLIRSSQVKELAAFGVDISPMVPEIVKEKVLEKINSYK